MKTVELEKIDPRDMGTWPVLMTPEQCAKALQMGRSATYELLRTNVIPHVNIGRLIRVHKDDLYTFNRTGGLNEAPSQGLAARGGLLENEEARHVGTRTDLR